MSRRALTIIPAAVLAVGLASAGGWVSVPYVELSPGPAYNTLGTVDDTKSAAAVLTIKGAKTYPTDGELALTTVSVRDRISLVEALAGWFNSSKAVVPRELVYPPEQSTDETQQRNVEEMKQSQDDATTAALRQLGYKGTSVVNVGSVQKDRPAENKLHAGDVITHIDGARVADIAALRKLISARKIGDPVVVGFLHEGKAGTVTLATVASEDTPPRPVIGISAATTTTFPVSVEIMLKDVGGPSAGLMFALGIIDKLGPDSLTGGHVVAGTGEITPEGAVGAIGGIAQKMRGAKAAGATVFLSPAGNCDEARSSKPDGLQVLKVGTLKEALAALEALRTGGTPATC